MTPEKIEEHRALCTELIVKLPNGKWASEIHRLNWKAHGLDCMIVRQPICGHLCGYVGVPEGHALHGKSYNDEDFGWPEVHGGLTYSEACTDHVCHIPEPGEPDTIWWFGFDCAHSGDLIPGWTSEEYKKLGITSFTGGHGETYKDIEYVVAEAENLAKQLAERAA